MRRVMFTLSIAWVAQFVVLAILLALEWPPSSLSALTLPFTLALSVWGLTWVAGKIAASPHRRRARSVSRLTPFVAISTVLTIASAIGVFGGLLVAIVT